MPLTPIRYVPNDVKISMIEIVSYEHKNPVGTIQNPFCDRKISFDSATELLLILDQMLDSLNYPQAARASRCFKARPSTVIWNGQHRQQSPLAVFKLRVLFRQHASWQGTLAWVDRAEIMPFRSVLEMLKLMDGVLSYSNQSGIQAGSK